MFLTPPELAYDIASHALALLPDGQTVNFGDPAVGPGIFFAALRKLSEPLKIESAVGVEINPTRARATAHRWRRAGLKVLLGDFLTRKPSEHAWNLLLANPPYVRHQEINRPLGWLRNALYERTGVKLDGRADLYVYFVLSAHDWLDEDGVASWLIPSEFASTDFGHALRTYLSNHVQLCGLHFYDQQSPFFDNARISSSVVTYRKRRVDDEALVSLSRGGTLENPAEVVSLPIAEFRRPGKWNWQSLTAPYASDGQTIGDFFEIKRGIATGANSAFLLTDADLVELNVDAKWVRPVVPKRRTLTSTTIEADASGNPLVVDRRWLIDTSEPFDRIARKSPKFAQYLSMIEAEYGTRALVRQRRPFYKQEARISPDFVFVYMAKSEVNGDGRFLRNASSAVVLNNYLGMTMKPGLALAAQAEPYALDLVEDALHRVPSLEFLRHGRNYISGLVKLEPKDLAQVRISLPSRWLSGII